ncbi:MAG TPA: DUF1326 domain-containing protein [Fimbriimonadaceae bacterium]|nr:DUF1326 domain-containing protein [Fimbriimonadaceae bacterium]
MKKYLLFAAVVAMSLSSLALADGPKAKHAKDWSIKADYIEACSCGMFCPCYFNPKPEGGLMCEFNMAVKIAEGHVGDVNVTGKKFWLSGDLGADFNKPKAAVVTFDTGLTKEEKNAIVTLVTKIYPYKWQSVKLDEAAITWDRHGMDAHATLGGGDKGDIVLKGLKGQDGKQTTITNIKYWGADRNDGFELAYSTHHYKGNGFNYSHENRNGFFVHIESAGSE